MNSRKFILIILTLLMGACVVAQQNYRFEHISVDQGLSQSTVTSMIQDKYGFLWLGTMDGMNQYDGQNFKVFRKREGDSTSLFSNEVQQIIVDNQGSLWIGTRGCLSRHLPQSNSFQNYPIKLGGRVFAEASIQNIFPLDGDRFAVSTDNGLLEFDARAGRYSIPDRWKFLENKALSAYCKLPKLGEWVFMTDSILVAKGDNKKWQVIKSPGENLCLCRPAVNEIFVRNYNYIIKYDSAGNSRVLDKTVVYDKSDKSPMCILSNGQLMVGSNYGVRIYNPDGTYQATLINTPEDKSSISGDDVWAIFETRDAVVWIASTGFGLNKYDPQVNQFSYLGVSYGVGATLSNSYIDAIYTDDDNTLYVCTVAGLDVVNVKEKTSRHFDYPSSKTGAVRGRAIQKEPSGKIRIIAGGEYDLLEFSNDKIIPCRDSLLNSEGFISSHRLPSGKNLVLTQGGAHIKDGRKYKKVTNTPDAVYLVTDDAIWLGNPFKSMISVVDMRTEKLIGKYEYSNENENSAPIGAIKCMFQDSKKRIWIGTAGGGLSLYNPKTKDFTHFTEENYLPNNVVYGILEDDLGNLWMSTNKGICEFNVDTKRVRTFDVNDGLQSNEFNTGAFFKSKSGTLYFGGINGVTYFKPENIETKNYIPQSVITAYYINNKLVSDNGNYVRFDSLTNSNVMRLNSSERDFGFDIAGLGFSFPGRIRHRYMLENYDKEWNDIGKLTHINFTNIPPGNYTLKVKSSNSLGQWEEEGMQLRIIVDVPLWKRPLIWGWAVFFLVAGTFSVYFFRLRAVRTRAAKLAAIVDQRTREIQIQKEEIAAQNEELFAQADVLEERNSELTKAKQLLEEKNFELVGAKELLEVRVDERTKELKALNSDLVSQNTKLEQFAFILAHNIRGPVARIKGLTGLMFSDKSNDEMMAHLKTSVGDLDTVISDLTEILNIRNGIEKTAEIVDLKVVLEDVIRLLADSIKSINATVETSQFTAIQMKGIKVYFNSIFYNLLHNALKYASNHKPATIIVSCKKVEDKVVIVFSDNGIGIDMRYAKNKIFNLYQRFHTEVQGKGFGLYLVKTEVEAMGGTISVHSEIGKGTEFTMEFPVG